MKRSIAALLALPLSFALGQGEADAAVAYLRSSVATPPWGTSDNEAAMDLVFGAGQWDDLRYETVDTASLFSPTYTFIYLEGSDGVAIELQTFLTANQASLQSWVAAGGHVFINSAPNEGGDQTWGFGDVTLVYSAPLDPAMPYDDMHPIWGGPFLPINTVVSGGGYAHAHVTGGSLVPVIIDTNGDAALAELPTYGDGMAMFGGLTVSSFWVDATDGLDLRANILWYLGQADVDHDYVLDAEDNCVDLANTMQDDADSDGVGDICDHCPADADDDGDGDTFCADVDNCPNVLNYNQADADADGVGDVCDPCPLDDADDVDGDNVCGDLDNCPLDANEDQADADGDGLGDACDDGGDSSGGMTGGDSSGGMTGGDSSGGVTGVDSSGGMTSDAGTSDGTATTSTQSGDDAGGCGCSSAPSSPRAVGLTLVMLCGALPRRRSRGEGAQAR